MGYIDDFTDIMAMETGFLQHMVEILKKEYSTELEILKVKLPEVEKIPAVTFTERNALPPKNMEPRSKTHTIWSRRKNT